MKRIGLIFGLLIFVSCGSRKAVIRNDVSSKRVADIELNAELARTMELLKMLDITLRQEEVRDSAGNEYIITEIRAIAKEQQYQTDTAIVSQTTQIQENTIDLSIMEESRKPATGKIMWSIWGMVALAVIAAFVYFKTKFR